jgi:hypothetical protein
LTSIRRATREIVRPDVEDDSLQGGSAKSAVQEGDHRVWAAEGGSTNAEERGSIDDVGEVQVRVSFISKIFA